jgi:hypothetical protein
MQTHGNCCFYGTLVLMICKSTVGYPVCVPKTLKHQGERRRCEEMQVWRVCEEICDFWYPLPSCPQSQEISILARLRALNAANNMHSYLHNNTRLRTGINNLQNTFLFH